MSLLQATNPDKFYSVSSRIDSTKLQEISNEHPITEDEPLLTFGKLVRCRREKMGWKQSEAARYLKMSSVYLHEIENDKKIPKKFFDVLCKTFNISEGEYKKIDKAPKIDLRGRHKRTPKKVPEAIEKDYRLSILCQSYRYKNGMSHDVPEKILNVHRTALWHFENDGTALRPELIVKYIKILKIPEAEVLEAIENDKRIATRPMIKQRLLNGLKTITLDPEILMESYQVNTGSPKITFSNTEKIKEIRPANIDFNSCVKFLSEQRDKFKRISKDNIFSLIFDELQTKLEGAIQNIEGVQKSFDELKSAMVEFF